MSVCLFAATWGGGASADGAGGERVRPGYYRLAMISVRVADQTAAGEAWDVAPFKSPDIALEIQVNGEKVASCPITADVFEVLCESATPFQLGAGAQLTIVVSDDDVGKDDA